MKTMVLLFISILAAFLSACDSLQTVQSRIPWNAQNADMECIKKAVLATPQVEYRPHEFGEMHGVCGFEPCKGDREQVVYEVNENSKKRFATISINENKTGKKQINHIAYGGNHQKFIEGDRKGFIEAQKAINANILKFCPEVGVPTDPH